MSAFHVHAYHVHEYTLQPFPFPFPFMENVALEIIIDLPISFPKDTIISLETEEPLAVGVATPT